MIETCRNELKTVAEQLERIIADRDSAGAINAILQIQASALLHGLDEIAVLAAEAEHAVELVAKDTPGWTAVSRKLIQSCRQSPREPGAAA